MKISKSKQELARIISENGGWRDGAEFYASTCNGIIIGSKSKPKYTSKYGWTAAGGFIDDRIEMCSYLKNWHQTILSRDEYFHLYPATDADGWIEWKGGECPVEKGTLVDVIWRDGTERSGVKALHLGGAGHQFWVADGMTNDIIAYRLHKQDQAKPEFCESVTRSIPEPSNKPTIEQLAAEYRNAKDYADRKQQEADSAKADAEAKLAELVATGKASGLVLSVATHDLEPVITDWRDLRSGDIVVVTGSDNPGWKSRENQELEVRIDGDSCEDVYFGGWCMSNNTDWRFIRRP